jgi:predicted metal-binding transcription factor (methanogenesis marker protein 9)
LRKKPTFLFKVLEQAELDLTPEEFAEIKEEFPIEGFIAKELSKASE